MPAVRAVYQMTAGQAFSKTLLPKLSEQTSHDFVSAHYLAPLYRPKVATEAIVFILKYKRSRKCMLIMVIELSGVQFGMKSYT